MKSVLSQIPHLRSRNAGKWNLSGSESSGGTLTFDTCCAGEPRAMFRRVKRSRVVIWLQRFACTRRDR